MLKFGSVLFLMWRPVLAFKFSIVVLQFGNVLKNASRC